MSILKSLLPYNHGFVRWRKFRESELEVISRIVACRNDHGNLYARVYLRDGSDFTISMAAKDDVPEGTELSLDLCQVICTVNNAKYKAMDITEKECRNVCDLHYEGLDYSPDWVEVGRKPLTDCIPAERIGRIEAVPFEYGLKAKIMDNSGNQIALYGVDWNSDEMLVGDLLDPCDCYLTEYRRYHTKRFTALLWKKLNMENGQ